MVCIGNIAWAADAAGVTAEGFDIEGGTLPRTLVGFEEAVIAFNSY